MSWLALHFVDLMTLLNSVGVFIVALQQKPKG